MLCITLQRTESTSAISPGKFSPIVDSSAYSLLLANKFVLPRTMYGRPGWINRPFRLLFKFKVLEYIAPNNILIETDSLFAQGVQIAISVDTSSEIWLKLLTQIKVLYVNFVRH
jgi:hypothetical protein